MLGASDASVLLLSALAGAAGVAACVALSRALGRPGAVLVALLLALSPVWVRLSTVAAPEQAAVCLALLAAGTLSHAGAVRGRSTRRAHSQDTSVRSDPRACGWQPA
ncbi:MAG: glycosyltransferase family 39 protein [Chloroflexia bacterium]